MAQGLNNAHTVIADFFSSGYRLSGSFDARQKSLADTLYDNSTSYMMVESAYLSPVTSPAQIMSYHPRSVITKNNIDFILALEEATGYRTDMRYALPPYRHSIFIIIPMFIVTGDIFIHQRTFNPKAYLSMDAGAFITAVKVTARCTYNPDIAYEGASALINRDKISCMGEYTQPEDDQGTE